jgi:TPR repeat protein
MTHLGFLYANGRGVSRDDMRALEWYRKAAKKGDATAMRNIGLMYRKGEGVPKDQREAVRWFFRAAEKGEVGAYYNLWRMKRGKALQKMRKLQPVTCSGPCVGVMTMPSRK